MTNIRKIKKQDSQSVFDMMRIFYNSPLVISTPSDEILKRNINDCLSDIPFVEGYVFEENNDIIGYAMMAKSYSTEFGGMCIWIEDIYIKSDYRHMGIGSRFLKFIENEYKGKAVLMRLEAENENKKAVAAYEKNGFSKLPYIEMIKEI